MNKILLCIFLIYPTVVWSQGASNCPLKLPFEIRVLINGNYDSFWYSSDSTSQGHRDTIISSNSYHFLIDTNVHGSTFSYAGDSLVFEDFDTNNWNAYYFRAIIHFDTLAKIITSLNLRSDTVFDQLFNTLDSVFWGLTASNISYRSDSLLSSGKEQNLSSYSSWIQHGDVPPISWTYGYYKLISGSVQISGATKAMASVNSISCNSGIIIQSEKGNLKCYFDPSDRIRFVELYTPLGIKAGSVPVPPDQSSVTIPHVSAGLYFVRMGNAVVKIVVPGP
jgi:hypothetical protein